MHIVVMRPVMIHAAVVHPVANAVLMRLVYAGSDGARSADASSDA